MKMIEATNFNFEGPFQVILVIVFDLVQFQFFSPVFH